MKNDRGVDSLCRCSGLLAWSEPIPKEVEEVALSVAMPGSGRLFMSHMAGLRSATSAVVFTHRGASATQVHCDDHALCVPGALSLASALRLSPQQSSHAGALQTCVHDHTHVWWH